MVDSVKEFKKMILDRFGDRFKVEKVEYGDGSANGRENGGEATI